MTIHSKALHHQNIRKRIYIKHETFPHPNKVKRFFDYLIYAVVIAAPVMHLPQLLKIWVEKDATGVSLISWLSFSIFSLIWVIYGILHKDTPIIVMNFILMLIQALIATGVIIYG